MFTYSFTADSISSSILCLYLKGKKKKTKKKKSLEKSKKLMSNEKDINLYVYLYG